MRHVEVVVAKTPPLTTRGGRIAHTSFPGTARAGHNGPPFWILNELGLDGLEGPVIRDLIKLPGERQRLNELLPALSSHAPGGTIRRSRIRCQ